MNQRYPNSRSAFSLVVSLIILTLLAILVTGFLSSTAMDRVTAHAFASKTQAESTANAGANQAMSLLREYIARYPDSATMWETLKPGTGPDVEGTMLYYNDRPPATSASLATPTSPFPVQTRYILPLMSRGVDANGALLGPVLVSQKGTALGNEPWVDAYDETREVNTIDLNRRRSNTDVDGWIGSPPTTGANPTPRPFRAKWIDVKENGIPTGKTVARYAFWIEDESFKLNLNTLDNNNKEKDSTLPLGGRGPEFDITSPTPITGELTRLDGSKPLAPQWAGLLTVPGLLQSLRAPTDLISRSTTTKVKAIRDPFVGQRLPDLESFNQLALASGPGGGTPFSLGDKAKFLATVHSGALNMSRQGSQRLNLNSPRLGFNRDIGDLTFNDGDIKLGVDRLVKAINYHAPRFGQRFYRDSLDASDVSPTVLNATVNQGAGVKAKYEEQYLYKIAANIRDYIDPDTQPTMVYGASSGGADPVATMSPPPMGGGSSSGSIREIPSLARPDSEGPQRSEVWAQGKDAAPFLQEAVARYRIKVVPTPRTYELQIDYYVEFWNMSNRNIYAGPVPDNDPTGLSIGYTTGKPANGKDPVIKRPLNPVLRITNQLAWQTTAARGLIANAWAAPFPPTDPIKSGDPSATDVNRAMVLDLTSPDPSQPTVFCNNAPCPNGVVFKAGQFTVITSDPDYLTTTTAPATSAPFSGRINRNNTYYCKRQVGSKSNRFYAGNIQNNALGVKPDFRNSGEDYVTEVVLSNSLGYLEFHASPFAHGGGAKETKISSTTTPPPVTVNEEYWYGGTLYGNSTATSTASQLADPRTNNESIVYTRWISGGSSTEPDQARYWNTTSSPRFSLGYPNVGGGGLLYQNPHYSSGAWPGGAYPSKGPYPWPDYYRGWNMSSYDQGENPTADTAPAFTPMSRTNGAIDDNLTSIGQLGDVFDPARFRANRGSAGPEGSRGGGRTLRIGQHDDRVDFTTPNAASLNWASWRLTDFLSVTDELQLPGLININGVQRDNGAALRAACYGLKLRSVSRSGETTPSPAILDFDTSEGSTAEGFNKLLESMTNTNPSKPLGRMVKNDPAKSGYLSSKPYFGPFMERGELSELDIFNTGSSLLPGINMAQSFDRSREEFVRRLIEMTTTRGNIFSVYVMAETINEGPPPKKLKTVSASHKMKVTFQLVPKKDAQGTDFQVTDESFAPLTPSSVNERFAKPHHYDVQILQVSS